MRAVVIPTDYFDAFNVWLVPNIWRVAPAPIFKGPHSGKYAINAEIIHASVEFRRDDHKRGPAVRAVTEILSKRSKGEPVTADDVTVEQLDSRELTDPDLIKIPATK